MYNHKSIAYTYKCNVQQTSGVKITSRTIKRFYISIEMCEDYTFSFIFSKKSTFVHSIIFLCKSAQLAYISCVCFFLLLSLYICCCRCRLLLLQYFRGAFYAMPASFLLQVGTTYEPPRLCTLCIFRSFRSFRSFIRSYIEAILPIANLQHCIIFSYEQTYYYYHYCYFMYKLIFSRSYSH